MTFDTEAIKPLLLGVSAIVIILVAYVASAGEDGAKLKKKKAVAVTALASAAASSGAATSKKSKKKKLSPASSKSKAPAAAPPLPPVVEKNKVVVIQEPEPEPVEAAAKKKKKKTKKKSPGNGAAPSSVLTPSSFTNGSTNERDDDSDDDDDNIDLWRISSLVAAKKGGVGAIDAAKRAAANKERDRVRALRRQEEKAKAEARAIAEEEEERIRLEAEATAKAALLEAAKKKSVAEKSKAVAKSNGGSHGATSASVGSASANGSSNTVAFVDGATKIVPTITANGTAAVAFVDETPAVKKKRKRSKKKGGGPAASVPESRQVLVKPALSVEHWEVVPKVEEWQEVGTKKAKAKAADFVSVTAVPSLIPPGGDAAAGVGMESPPPPLEAEETSVTLPTGDDPLIFMGKGGATIQNLQETTGAKFHLNRSTNVLTISGLEDAVQLGLAAARSILAAEVERKASEVEERVTWGSDAIKAVIGRGGSNIRAAQEATGTRINADVDAGTLVIVGVADQVSIALTMCKNAAFGEVQDVIELSSRNAVNLIYGQNFQTIRAMQESTGCKLDIARGSTTLKLSGSNDAVAKARTSILALLEINRGFEMTIEVSKVGAVYGKGGETLRSIQDKTSTQIDVARGPTHATISVMGSAEASGRARNMLQRAIDGDVELKPGEIAEEIELGSATAAVIGRGGSNVALLEKKHGVKVNVRSELHKARVVGKPEKVEECVKEITAIVEPILATELAQKKAEDALQTGESEWQIEKSIVDDAEGW